MRKLIIGLSALALAAWLMVEFIGNPEVAIDSAPISAPEKTASASDAVGFPAPNSANDASKVVSNAANEAGKWPPRGSIAQMPPPEDDRARERREVRELSAQDPLAALARVEQMPLREDRMLALIDVCPHLSRKDPALAMEAVWRLELGKSASGASEGAALENVARKWAAADLPAAAAWASQQPAEEDGRRDRVLRGIACVWADATPEDGARLVVDQMSSGPAQIEAVMAVLDKWAARDLAGASAWVEQFPEGAVRDAAVDKLNRVANPPVDEVTPNQ